MIVRVVRLTFREEEVTTFQKLFTDRSAQIRAFHGCLHLALWRDVKEPNVFCTYSHWEDGHALDNYRFSGFFKETWALTKSLFAAPPVAWSATEEIVL